MAKIIYNIENGIEFENVDMAIYFFRLPAKPFVFIRVTNEFIDDLKKGDSLAGYTIRKSDIEGGPYYDLISAEGVESNITFVIEDSFSRRKEICPEEEED